MTLPNASQRALRDYIKSIESLEVEKKSIADDIKEKFSEAKGAGFDVKAMRKIIKLRKQSQDDRDHEQAIMDTYMHALQMFDGTPMGAHIADQMQQEEARVQ